MGLLDKITDVDVLGVVAETFLFLAGYFAFPAIINSPNAAYIAPLGYVAEVGAMAGVAHSWFQAKTALGSVSTGPGPSSQQQNTAG